RRLLIAGVAALLASLLLGFGGASIFARRIRRLERAADRIAGGHFDQPVDDPTPDELGELARAFDRMRLRLAHLDRARAEFIANASHELRTPLFSLGGFLELELDGAGRALGDDERALRIGRALVENALRHTPPGTQVVVRAGGGTRPALEVADDGPGIPDSELGQVFDRFYRGDGSLASGSGLGLAIARELAERMDGRLEAESRPGHTVFRLVLPPAEAFSRENAAVVKS